LKWISHETKGLTPGQQLGHVAGVTPADIRRAKAWATEKGYDWRPIHPVFLALNHRAHALAAMNGWSTQDAWSVIMSAHKELLAYTAHKLPAVEPVKPDLRPTLYVDGAQLGDAVNPSQDIEEQDFFELLPVGVAQEASHMDAESLEAQGFETDRSED
jgi:hypothetical protein